MIGLNLVENQFMTTSQLTYIVPSNVIKIRFEAGKTTMPPVPKVVFLFNIMTTCYVDTCLEVQ